MSTAAKGKHVSGELARQTISVCRKPLHSGCRCEGNLSIAASALSNGFLEMW